MLLARVTGDADRLPRNKCTYRPCAIRHSVFRTLSERWQRLDHEKAGKISWPPDKNEVNESSKFFRLRELAARAEGRPKRPRCTARREQLVRS
jgi:hypothetical protein